MPKSLKWPVKTATISHATAVQVQLAFNVKKLRVSAHISKQRNWLGFDFIDTVNTDYYGSADTRSIQSRGV